MLECPRGTADWLLLTLVVGVVAGLDAATVPQVCAPLAPLRSQQQGRPHHVVIVQEKAGLDPNTDEEAEWKQFIYLFI